MKGESEGGRREWKLIDEIRDHKERRTKMKEVRPNQAAF